MHTKIKKRLIKTLTITIIVYMIFSPLIAYGSGLDPSDIINSWNPSNLTGVTTLYSVGNKILGMIQYAGAAVAIIATLVLGIKYMYSAPDDKAEIKKKLIPYIIGGVLIFGAVSLVKLAETFAQDLFN